MVPARGQVSLLHVSILDFSLIQLIMNCHYVSYNLISLPPLDCHLQEGRGCVFSHFHTPQQQLSSNREAINRNLLNEEMDGKESILRAII